MEDILASIRRILDEEAPADAPETPEAREPGTTPDHEPKAIPAPLHAEVLELDSSMMIPEPDTGLAGPIPAPPPIRAEPMPHPLPPIPGPGLIAPAAAAAAASSVGALLKTLASERGTAVSRGGPTIEDMVRDEIRPLLKEWLDTHLAPMVERLVRAEIERVINRT